MHDRFRLSASPTGLDLPPEPVHPMIRVFIITATRLYRDGLADILARKGFLIVGTQAAGLTSAESVARERPDVVLLEVTGPRSIPVIRALTRVAPVKVVALAMPEVEDDLISYAEAGIAGYVARDEGSISELVATINSVSRGETLCSPRMAATLLRRVARLASVPATERPRVSLTPRQLDIMRLLDRGLSNKEIARDLCIQVPTVKNHLSVIFEKFGVRRRSQVVARARDCGLLAGPQLLR
jgi:two-component system, NarL family, nitrate/nitrite response regulator NarL